MIIPPHIRAKEPPETPGVYLMKNEKGAIIYVGKAANLKRRVSSYFTHPHDSRIEKMVSEIRAIDYEETGSALEALIREAELIKALRPPYNIKDKDDKSFLFIEITKDPIPRVILVRGKDPEGGKRYGPFPSASQARDAYRLLRRIFGWNTHTREELERMKRPCLDFEIGLCPGCCSKSFSRPAYKKILARLTLFLEGKRERVITSLKRAMETASKKKRYEEAGELKRELFALEHIHDIALITEDAIENSTESHRIEGYDISNIGPTATVASMVVFEGGRPRKQDYRTFKIHLEGQNDTAMLREVLTRRFSHPEWRFPDLILVDGGIPQTNAAYTLVRSLKLRIPVIGMAKGPERKRTDIIGMKPGWATHDVLVRVRDEAHRFAIGFHRKVRGKRFLPR